VRQDRRQLWLFASAVLVVAAAITATFWDTLTYLSAHWEREEYSHGVIVPFISLYLIWQRRHLIAAQRFQGSWAGLALVVAGLLLYFLASLAAITGFDAYSLVMVIAGSVLALVGWRVFKVILVPIVLLLLMVPIPTLFYNNLSAKLQLVSSEIGVAVIRLFGISVFLEGNVIDLGAFKLQVAEACSGLRYLFPLMTLGVIVAYMFKGKMWMRWCIFLSTIPITILMNSFRIGVIGVLVDRYGVAQAQGFLHDFEGWVVFMACFAMLFLECWVLWRISGDRRSFRDVLLTEPLTPEQSQAWRSMAPGLRLTGVIAAVAVAITILPAHIVSARTEQIPLRSEFSDFPLQMEGWKGRHDRLETVYLDELQLDDYLLANYTGPAVDAESGYVNLYAAYYKSQRSGQTVHSPRSCIPGGGWQIQQLEEREVGQVMEKGRPLRVNRAVIQRNEQRQLVYYWFQQRGRNVTNEYLVKWYVFVDSLTRNRTDGALVRLVTPIGKHESLDAGDARLAQFSAGLLPQLGAYLPD
jgi:exosortase D (VPLPA-CTERM-specific)